MEDNHTNVNGYTEYKNINHDEIEYQVQLEKWKKDGKNGDRPQYNGSVNSNSTQEYVRSNLEDSSAMNDYKEKQRHGEKKIKDEYMGKDNLYVSQNNMPDNYNDETHRKQAQPDHIVPLKQLHEQYKHNYALDDSDLKRIANSESNLAITSAEINQVKRDMTNKQYIEWMDEHGKPLDENTKKIMDILAKYDAKATFFVTGRNQDYNYLIKDAYNAGHTIALHTYSHEYSTVYASVDAYFDDLNKVGQMVKKEIGFVPHYIRFPGGSSNTVSRRYCQGIMSTLTKEVVEKGYQYYDWNGDSTDASGNHVAVDKLIRNGTSCHDNNVMILCHDTQAKDTTVQALPAIIEHYKNLGYTFKGIDDATYAPHQSVNN